MHGKLKTIITLSIISVAMPFLGFPLTWKVWMTAVLSAGVVVLAYKLLRSRNTSRTGTGEREPAYAESKPESFGSNEEASEYETAQNNKT